MITTSFHDISNSTIHDLVFETHEASREYANSLAGTDILECGSHPATLVDVILASSRRINDQRDVNGVLIHAIEKVGELAQEVLVYTGKNHKVPCEDGVVGEAIDAIACLIDLIYTYNPDITEDELATIAYSKCLKWERNTLGTNDSARQGWEQCPSCRDGKLVTNLGGSCHCDMCSYWNPNFRE